MIPTTSNTGPTCDRKDVSKCIFKDYTRRGDTCIAPAGSHNYDAYSLANHYSDTTFDEWLNVLYNRNAGSDPNKNESSNVHDYRNRCYTFTKSNLLTRYDASSSSNYILNGNTVTKWIDLSDNGYHLTVNGTGPTLTTINSVPAFNFNPNGGFISNNVPLSTPITIFIVITYKNIAGTWGNFIHHGHRDTDWAVEKIEASNFINFQSNNDNDNVKIQMQNDKNYILVGRIVKDVRQFWAYSDTLPPVYVEKNSSISITAGNKTLYVGKSDNNEACNSIIGEILYYNSSLSDSNVNTNVKYLQNKWFSTTRTWNITWRSKSGVVDFFVDNYNKIAFHINIREDQGITALFSAVKKSDNTWDWKNGVSIYNIHTLPRPINFKVTFNPSDGFRIIHNNNILATYPNVFNITNINHIVVKTNDNNITIN
jgi:hypothetical protein